MTKGFVYILINQSMPGIVKIGKTSRSVHQRATELWQTGVPTPFQIFDHVPTPNCDELEMWMHERFADSRVSSSREFFTVDAAKASVALLQFLQQQVTSLVDECCPDSELIDRDLAPNWVDVYTMAAHLDVEARDVVRAFSYLTPDELRPALERFEAKVKERCIANKGGQEMPPFWNENGSTIQ